MKISEKKNAVVLIALLAVLVTAGNLLYADPQVNQKDVLKFFIIDSKPFGYKDADGTMKGIHVDLLDALAKQTGIKIEKNLVPYARIWKDLETGVIDAGVIWRTAARDGIVDYASFVFTDYLTALTVKGGKPLAKYDDLYAMKSVGLLRASSINEQFDADTKIRKYETNDYEQAIMMLSEGRLDAAVGNVFAYLFIVNQLKLKTEIALPGIKLGTRDQWLQMSKKSEYLKYLPNLASGIDVLRKNGTIEKINLKYYGEAYRQVKF